MDSSGVANRMKTLCWHWCTLTVIVYEQNAFYFIALYLDKVTEYSIFFISGHFCMDRRTLWGGVGFISLL